MGHLTRKHRRIIGIDPGKKPGWSMFVGGVLSQAGTKVDKLFELLAVVPDVPAVVVVEKPVVYVQGRGSKGDPNDIVTLAVLAGRLAGRIEERVPGIDVEFVTPRRWKGSVPKSITNKRTLAALSNDERVRLPKRPRAKDYDHNMLDAVGVGLWQCEREQWR